MIIIEGKLCNNNFMFENYERYLGLINNKLLKFFEEQKPYIKCQKGCAKCCKNAEFPYSKMEFKYLLSGFLTLNKETQDIIENKIKETVDKKKKFQGDKFLYDCPFLINDVCSVYDYRGIICRAFGLIESVKDGNSKIPFCAYIGLNYSNVLDKDENLISEIKFKALEIEQKPLSYNISYKFLTNEDFEKKYNFKFEEKKALIDWFINE